MAESYGPFQAGAGANFLDTQWGEMFNLLLSSGVFKGAKVSGSAGGDLAVTTGGGLSVNVATGQAWVYGRWYQNDAAKNLALATADPSLPRIDYLVIKMDDSAHTIAAVVVTGTPASSPTAPALTQTATTWMIPLATVRVNAGATTPTSITDARAYATISNLGTLANALLSDGTGPTITALLKVAAGAGLVNSADSTEMIGPALNGSSDVGITSANNGVRIGSGLHPVRLLFGGYVDASQVDRFYGTNQSIQLQVDNNGVRCRKSTNTPVADAVITWQVSWTTLFS